jgi:hypothetical protein
MNQGVWNTHSVLDWVVVVEKGMGEVVSIPIRRIDSDDWHDGRDWMCKLSCDRKIVCDRKWEVSKELWPR